MSLSIATRDQILEAAMDADLTGEDGRVVAYALDQILYGKLPTISPDRPPRSDADRDMLLETVAHRLNHHRSPEARIRLHERA